MGGLYTARGTGLEAHAYEHALRGKTGEVLLDLGA
jgi:hypothetical protein